MATLAENKVLVVQNNVESRNVIKYILRGMGFAQVQCACNGREALDDLKKGTFRIVISDWHLQLTDGLSLLRTVREEPSMKGVIFIMVTAEKDRNKVLDAKNSGVDGYLTKPFTAEALCRRIVTALREKYPETSSAALRRPPKNASEEPGKHTTKIFGEVLTKGAVSSAVSWSMSPHYLSHKPRTLIKGNLVAMLHIMSPQFDMMKAAADFVGVEEIIRKAEATMKNMERQTENANLIVNATEDISRALDVIESAPGGSAEAMQGMMVLDQSAAKLSDMLDSFDKDIADIVAMLSGMEQSVRQAQISEINKSIEDSYAIESGEGLKSEITGNAGSSVEKAVEKLSAMRTGSEVTCEAITKAAENISQVIERIEAPGLSELPSSKTCGQLRHRIEHIMEMLDSQAEIVATMESGMKEAAEVRQNVVEPDRTAATDTVVAETCAEQERPDDRKSGGGTPAAIKKILDNRILVIDIIRKEHAMSVGTLGELLRGSSEISREQLPGNPEDSLSKWIEHYIERDDFFYDPVKCKQLAGFRDNMFACAMRAVEAFGAGKKDDMANNYQNVRQFSEQIESLLKEMRDDLQKNI